MKIINKDYDCHCWNDYPNENHKYYGCSDTPKKSGKWKCVDCYEYVGKSKFGATHCKKKNKGAVIMTIDEAISEFKERAEDSKKISELGMKSYIPKEKEEKQLVEWLEELKSYRASVFSGDMTQKMLEEEYCKVVDDFAESVKNLIINLSVIRFKDIDEIAEQLKVGK